MRNECKCTNPDGGGTKCPPQHLAVCIRAKDKECYGECVPIPTDYYEDTRDFNQWLGHQVEDVVVDYVSTNFNPSFYVRELQKLSEDIRGQGEKVTFYV